MPIKRKEENRESFYWGKKREDGLRYDDERCNSKEGWNSGRPQDPSNLKYEESKSSSFDQKSIEESKNPIQCQNLSRNQYDSSPASKKLPSYMIGQPFIPSNTHPSHSYNPYYPSPYPLNSNLSMLPKQEISESKLKDEFDGSNPNENSAVKRKQESSSGYNQALPRSMYERIPEIDHDQTPLEPSIQNPYINYMKPLDDPNRRNSYGSDNQNRDYKDKDLLGSNQSLSQYEAGKSTMPKSSYRSMNYSMNDYKYYDQMYQNGYYYDPRMYNYNSHYSIDPTVMQGSGMHMPGYPYPIGDRDTGYMGSYPMHQDPYAMPYGSHQGANSIHSMPDYRYSMPSNSYYYYPQQNGMPDLGYQYPGMNANAYGYQNSSGMNYEMQSEQSRIPEDPNMNRAMMRQHSSERNSLGGQKNSGGSDLPNDQSLHKK